MAAAIVVANPVAPPVRDLQISTTQLSTSPEALIPFDKNLLKSITQPTTDPDFSAALSQILGALAAEADRIGNEVNAGDNPVPVPVAAEQAPQFYTPTATEAPAIATPNGTPSASSTVPLVSTVATTPGVQQIVTDLAADTTYLGNKVVEAAYAAVSAIVNTPSLFVKAVELLFKGDFSAALETVIEAVKGFLDPGLIIVGGIGNILNQYAPQPNRSIPNASATAAAAVDVPAPSQSLPEDGGRPVADSETTDSAAPGDKKQTENKGTGSTRRSITRTDLTPVPAGSAATEPADGPQTPAGAPGTGSALRSAAPGIADHPERATTTDPGATRPGPASTARSQGSVGRGPQPGD